ncbi:hypothetical protein RUM43_001655 [Polyplax serrata]|uniref:BHLH domain-containing protein n=1 Tax=Polyplax serrata TaxID=468196 RepID=A0AAN8SFS5_POLSC
MEIFTNQDISVEGKIENEGDGDNNNKHSNSSSIKQEKYSLRPRSLRQTTEKGLELKKEILNQRNKRSQANVKPKQKPPPLSKYRRKTANARERNRMREINVAFETLRRAVPQISGTLNSGNEKLTKITTLRLAMKYIQALRQVLDGTSTHQVLPSQYSLDSFVEADDRDLDVLLSDGESLNFNSDMSESFASPEHPMTSPFSEFSLNENSPNFSDCHDFPFHDSVMDPEFCLEDNLTDTEFCDQFLIGGLS